MHKLVNDNSNNNNSHTFNSYNLSNQHTHNTRLSANSNYYLRRPRTNLGLRSFDYAGPKLWQSVPTEIKNVKFSLFKHKYKQLLIQSYTNGSQ